MVSAPASSLRSCSTQRRIIAAATAVLVSASIVTAVATSRPVAADVALSGPGAPAEGVLFGAHVKTGSSEAAQKSGVVALEAKLGRKLAIDHYYRPWTTAFPTTREQWDFDNGRIPMISWGKTYAENIVTGIHDELILQRADAIAALGQPLLIRWFWEMDGERNLQYSQSPASYVAAWQHIVSIFRQQGATNVDWVWCPNASAFSDGTAQQYYPGDDWVDWTCADGYNWYRKPGDNDVSFKNVFKSFYAWAVTRPKPIMVGEYGVLETSTERKANWVNAARTTLKADQSAIDAVVYFNSYGYDNNDIWRDWTMDTSASALDAFALMGADPYFNGAPAGPTPDTVISPGGEPSGAVREATATFSFSASPADPAATFGCRLDGGRFTPCTSPATLSGLADGSHTFEVRATTSGGTDPTAVARTWTVDTTPPTVTALSPVHDSAGVARDASASAAFSELVDPATVSPSTVALTGPGSAAVPVAVSYDSAASTATVRPLSLLAYNTTYTVTIKGGPAGVADTLGNRMVSDRVWRFATVAPPPVPDTFLDSAVPDPSTTSGATFSFSSDQPDAQFQCRLDGAAFTGCSSPATYTGLVDGQHTFETRAWTADGGIDPAPATRTWRVDTTPPAVTSTTPAADEGSVAPDGVVQVVFSEALLQASLSSSTFSLAAGEQTVDASIRYDPPTATATLTPAAALNPERQYTVTVRGGVTGIADIAGNPMAADKVWGFKTAGVSLPTPPATFVPVADVRVVKAHPKTNYGGSTTLAVDAGKASYIRFSITGLSGTVERATLRLYVTNGTRKGPAVFRTADPWTEQGIGSITWKNRPRSIGPALDAKGKVAPSTWVEFDVTAAVTGNGIVSFVLTGSASDTFAAYAREKSSKSPQLIIRSR